MEFCSEHAMVIDRLNRNDARLDAHSDRLDEMQILLTKLTEIADQNAERLRKLEEVPQRRHQTLETAVITAVITCLVTLFFSCIVPALG